MPAKRKLKKGIIKNFALIKKAKFFAKFQTTYSCSLQSTYTNIELRKAKETVENSKSKKKKRTNLILLIVNLFIIAGFIVYYALTSGIVRFKDLIYLDIKYQFLLLALFMVLVMIILESFRLYLLIKKSTGKRRFGLSIKTHLIGRYYDNITPFAIGGQPFQIFYLSNHDVSADKAVSIPFAKQIFTNIAVVLLGIIVLISNFYYNITTSTIIIIFAIIGLLANGLLIFLMLMFSINKRLAGTFVIKILKILHKLHIVKNYKVTFFKVNRFVVNYQKTMKALSKNVLMFIIQIILTLLMYAAYFSIVYFIYLAFAPLLSSGATIKYYDIVCCLMLCDLCSSIMPLPGGTGLAEISFDALFKGWFSPAIFPWALLIYRTLTCFIYMFIGVIQLISSFIKSTIVNRKNKKNK